MFGLFGKKAKINKSNKNKYLYIWEDFCDVSSERYAISDVKEGFLNIIGKVPEFVLNDFISKGYRIKIVDSLDFVNGDMISTKVENQILYVLDSDIVDETYALYSGFGHYLYQGFKDTREINHLFSIIGSGYFSDASNYFADMFGKYISGYYDEYPEKKDRRESTYMMPIIEELNRKKVVNDLRTALKYVVNKREKYDPVKDRMVSVIKGRGFEFSVSGAKNREEHLEVINDFHGYLTQCGYSADSFGSGTWEENVRMKSTKEFEFLYIPIDDVEEKEQIESIYKEWKAKR